MLAMQLTDWKLSAFYPQVPVYQRCFETGVQLEEMFEPMDAKVPGSVYGPLRKNGIIPDPYFEMNSLQCEWVKDRWWVYRTAFRLPQAAAGRNLRLRVGGMDYRGTVSLNGSLLGSHENMYTPFLADINDIVRREGENQISIVLEHAPDEMGQFGYTNRTQTQKARFSYKWDFSARMVQLGLNEPVCIEEFGQFAIESAKITPVPEGESATVSCAFDITGFRAGRGELRCSLSYQGEPVGEESVSAQLAAGQNRLCVSIPVPKPRLWYPNGSGEQPLYRLEVRLLDSDGLSDRYACDVGIRQIEYLPCENAPEDSLPYRLRVNGKDLYIKGVNLVPLDMMYADVDLERYEQTVRLMKQGNVNLVRVWGGGLIEREEFYTLCDQNGILVWQEFIQSSSGLNNAPSKDPAFLQKLADTAEEAVKARRNHVCLAYWCGGNELRNDAGTGPASYEDENIAMLRGIVERLHPEALMLPTSGSGPTEHIRLDQPGRNHDVHGPWKYGGAEGHYTLFNRSDSQLHAEFGVDGMNSVEELCRIMSPANRKVASMKENVVWRHHGGDWWDTLERDTGLFGAFDKEDLELFVKCSQYVQAEGIRYILESNRRRAFQNCGSIIWQFNEPWPNVSATNLVDYGLHRKLAYYAMKSAYRPITPNLRYDRLVYRKNEAFQGEVYLTSDSPIQNATVRASVLSWSGEVLLTEEFVCAGLRRHSQSLGRLEVAVPAEPCFRVCLEAVLSGGKPIANEYLFFVASEDGTCEKACAAWQYDRILALDAAEKNGR